MNKEELLTQLKLIKERIENDSIHYFKASIKSDDNLSETLNCQKSFQSKNYAKMISFLIQDAK